MLWSTKSLKNGQKALKRTLSEVLSNNIFYFPHLLNQVLGQALSLNIRFRSLTLVKQGPRKSALFLCLFIYLFNLQYFWETALQIFLTWCEIINIGKGKKDKEPEFWKRYFKEVKIGDKHCCCLVSYTDCHNL